MVARFDGAAGPGDEVGAQRHRVGQRDVVTDTRADRDLDAEFLAQFTGQRGRVGFPVRHLAAWELPQTCKFGRPVALGDEQGSVGDHRAGYHYLVRRWFRHCARRYTVTSWPCYRTKKWMP